MVSGEKAFSDAIASIEISFPAKWKKKSPILKFVGFDQVEMQEDYSMSAQPKVTLICEEQMKEDPKLCLELANKAYYEFGVYSIRQEDREDKLIYSLRLTKEASESWRRMNFGCNKIEAAELRYPVVDNRENVVLLFEDSFSEEDDGQVRVTGVFGGTFVATSVALAAAQALRETPQTLESLTAELAVCNEELRLLRGLFTTDKIYIGHRKERSTGQSAEVLDMPVRKEVDYSGVFYAELQAAALQYHQYLIECRRLIIKRLGEIVAEAKDEC